MGFIGKFANALRTDGTDHQETAADEAPDTESAETSSPSARLFRCSTCAKTYVTLSMETCPECEQAIEGIPNERDLGMV